MCKRTIGLVVLFALVAMAACGDSGLEALDPPVGEPRLPDLVPAPSVDVHTVRDDAGNWSIRFSSVLVNVGEGDFALRADREEGGPWGVEQEIHYSDSGGELRPTPAVLEWGGDGHDHWHVAGIALTRLLAVNDVLGADTKVGFCFFDTLRKLDRGPEEAVYRQHECGHEDDEELRMGLSVGWGDEYVFSLPGQSIDISGVPDGLYRLEVEADPRRWFVEATRDNNVTWVELELTTRSDGLRLAQVVDVGPEPA